MERLIINSVPEGNSARVNLDNFISKGTRGRIRNILSRESVQMEKVDLEELRDCFNQVFVEGTDFCKNE